MSKVIKRDGSKEEFNGKKILSAVSKTFIAVDGVVIPPKEVVEELEALVKFLSIKEGDTTVEQIQDQVENTLMRTGYFKEAKAFILYREKHNEIRDFATKKRNFIQKYKESANTANATIDDNSNVSSKNIGVLNAEIHKEDNVQISRNMITAKLKELYPDFDSKQYIRDLESHIIYKHDESSFAGAIAPYCCAISMYPFLNEGIKAIGGLSACPHNLDSFCGMYVNLIFATSAQFAGAVATPEVLLYFDYFARKEWGNDYYLNPDTVISTEASSRKKTIKSQIHQYFQQIIYSINQPAAARGLQSAFVNWSFFDEAFYHGMFDNFVFPDNSTPNWESLNWLQKDFMHWFNQERLRCILTFPVCSYATVFKDNKFVDQETADFIAKELSEGNSFFIYTSDTVDSLSSCCRLKNKVQTKEFSFTNGNMGIQTGSKSVITLNLNRIIQDWYKTTLDSTGEFSSAIIGTIFGGINGITTVDRRIDYSGVKEYLTTILERVYKYHTAYNELLWDMYNAGLLPIYKAGFINLNKQYLTIGLNGLNQAAEFLGLTCNDNEDYQKFCQLIFSTIKEQNIAHKTKKTTFNTEQVPAESLAIKNYNWDKADGYVVPEDTNLYASYIFKPNDSSVGPLERLRLHGNRYIGDYLDGGAAAHINLSEHPNYEQCKKLENYAATVGCQYWTINVPNSECQECGFITKVPITKCPHCGSDKIDLFDRVIGYLTRIKNWAKGRQDEQKLRVYDKISESLC